MAVDFNEIWGRSIIEAEQSRPRPRLHPVAYGAYAAAIAYFSIMAFRAHFDLAGSRFEIAHGVIAGIAFLAAAGIVWLLRRNHDNHAAFIATVRREQAEAEQRRKNEQAARWKARFPNGLPPAPS